MPSPETKPKVRFAPYLPRIFRRAISETAKYWNQYQVAAYLASLTFGAIWQLGQTHKQHANWAALKVVMVILGILLYSIVGLLSGLGLTFLVALACAPSLLDKDCQEEMANCKQENVVLKTALSEPTVSAQ